MFSTFNNLKFNFFDRVIILSVFVVLGPEIAKLTWMVTLCQSARMSFHWPSQR